MGKPKGGRRPGAGRKRILSVEDRLVVGALVEDELRLAAEGQTDAAIRKAFQDVDLESQWRRLHSIPVRQRQAWRRRLLVEGKSEEEDDSPISQLLADVSTDIGDRRHFPGATATPYGARRQALAEIARRRGLTVRMVEKCLEEYRAFKADDSVD